MNRILLASCVLALGATGLLAQSDPIATRENTMKGIGKAFYGDITKMQKGELPYDQATVDAGLDKIVAAAGTMPKLFPADSKTGEKTRALPKIWDNASDFDARFKKLGVSAASAKGSVKDLATLKVAFVDVNKNCSGCHQTYRAKEN